MEQGNQFLKTLIPTVCFNLFLKQVFPLNNKVWTTERMSGLHKDKNIF
jgi:hypothetical protein